MKIALYPGSFNPVHAGHVGLAEFVVQNKLADEVWLVVSPHNPLKINSKLQDEKHREKMTRLAVEGKFGLTTSTIEFSMPRPSYTIDTIRMLQSNHPDDQFVLMIGSDNALIFNQWKEFDRLLSMLEIFVYPRRGYSTAEAIRLYPSMKALETPYYEVSSTQLREWIKNGQDTAQWLHPAVLKYINDHKLYR